MPNRTSTRAIFIVPANETAKCDVPCDMLTGHSVRNADVDPLADLANSRVLTSTAATGLLLELGEPNMERLR